LAEALWTALGRLGARVTAVTDDPRAGLRATLHGLPVRSRATEAGETDHVILTGEGHDPVDPAVLHGTAIDASFGGTGLTPVDAASATRPGVRAAGTAWVVAVPALHAGGSALARAAVDAAATLDRLAAESVDDLDRRFAAAVQA
ncbi:MAG: hypothetical protein QM626_05905, partial [Microbacterium sp.]|uniref:hypothetical protein n=1 Tax=Microbacterium sp. TaxID=51671 RepID=UPI0039E26B6C